MRLIRQGSCSFCGECCGAAGMAAPWPAQLIDGLRHWRLADVLLEWPHAELIGLTQQADGRMVITTPSGQIKIRNARYAWQWDENGWHKPGSGECPLLMADPGNGTRPCGLLGTEYEDRIFMARCAEGLAHHGYPKFEYVDDAGVGEGVGRTAYEQLNDWMEEYPSCSFTYAEEAE